MNKGYTQEVKLNHNESIMILNKSTGEAKELVNKTRPNNIPEGKEVFEPDAIFQKHFTNSWKFLQRELSTLEFKAASSLAILAKANTNSLEPIDDNTAYKELSEILGVSINKVDSVLKKLWDYGIYGKFEVKQADKPYTKHWLLNPYLSFSGKVLHSDIAQLFKGTHIAKAFNNPQYRYKR